ncbi:MAG: tetratricopeptide repeat protein [Pseudonocardiales bacterium]|nr:tetratricopeptide repeat protein [Pseudonocardiales bacterium]
MANTAVDLWSVRTFALRLPIPGDAAPTSVGKEREPSDSWLEEKRERSRTTVADEPEADDASLANADLAASSLNSLALLRSNEGRLDEALSLFERVLLDRERILGPDHPDTLSSANNLANRLSALGEHEQARALHEDTLTRRRRVLGPDHPDTLSSANNLANRLSALGEHEQAAELQKWTAHHQSS